MERPLLNFKRRRHFESSANRRSLAREFAPMGISSKKWKNAMPGDKPVLRMSGPPASAGDAHTKLQHTLAMRKKKLPTEPHWAFLSRIFDLFRSNFDCLLK